MDRDRKTKIKRMEPLLRAIDVTKTYQLGSVAHPALRGVGLEICKGPLADFKANTA